MRIKYDEKTNLRHKLLGIHTVEFAEVLRTMRCHPATLPTFCAPVHHKPTYVD